MSDRDAGAPSTAPSAIHVYRVLQEALNNVARHSGAQQAWVRLRFDAGCRSSSRSRITAKDSAARRRGRGLGLVAMRERAELIGGTLEFDRPREGGTLMRFACRCACGRSWRIRSRSCSPTITASCAAASAACSKTIRRSTVVGEASNGDEAVALAAVAQAARRRDGLRDAGHQRARGDAPDPGSRCRRLPS